MKVLKKLLQRKISVWDLFQIRQKKQKYYIKLLQKLNNLNQNQNRRQSNQYTSTINSQMFNTKNYVNPKRTHPNSGQQKQFFRQFEPTNSKRPAFKSGGEVDPYSPDVAPMNIFENQVIPIGIHNISKKFRPNLATIRVLSLGMKFIPKTQSLQWKNNFANFEDFRRRLNNKMFFFV